MEGKIAQVSWSRRKYSNVFRSTIVDPSPLKHGQKVKVLWGKTKKEFSAVVTCYPVQEETENPETINDLARRRARAKRKLVSIRLRSNHSTQLRLVSFFYVILLASLNICSGTNSQIPESPSPPPAKKKSTAKTAKTAKTTKASTTSSKQKQKPKGKVCIKTYLFVAM